MFEGFRNKMTAPPLNLAPIEAVWFDLDGTLIEVEMERFIPAYLRRLAERLRP